MTKKKKTWLAQSKRLQTTATILKNSKNFFYNCFIDKKSLKARSTNIKWKNGTILLYV